MMIKVDIDKQSNHCHVETVAQIQVELLRN